MVTEVIPYSLEHGLVCYEPQMILSLYPQKSG